MATIVTCSEVSTGSMADLPVAYSSSPPKCAEKWLAEHYSLKGNGDVDLDAPEHNPLTYALIM